MLEIVCLALIVWCMSTTIATAKIFEGFRSLWEITAEDCKPEVSNFRFHLKLFFSELFTCQRCVAHWIAIGVCMIVPVSVVRVPWGLVEFFLNIVLVVAVNDVIARITQGRVRKGRNP